MAKKKDWKQKDIEKVKRCLSNGRKTTQIADLFNISMPRFYYLCRLHDINIRECRGLPKYKPRKVDPVKLKEREAKKKAYREKVELNRKKREIRRNHIAELRRSGLTYAEIGEKYGLTTEAIRQILCQYNKTADNPVPPEKYNHKRPPDPIVAARREKVAALRRSGLSHRQIAKRMKVSLGVIVQDLDVYNKTSDNPIPHFMVDKRHRIGDAEKKEIVRLRKFGVPVSEIALKYGVTAICIYRALSKMGNN